MSDISKSQAAQAAGSEPSQNSPRRQRGRLARLTGRTEGSGYSPILEPLIRTLKVRHPKESLDLVIRAFSVAEKHHSGQTRKSGDPYITHPVAVATILAELGMTGTTLAAALLHDTVEDTDYSLDQLSHDFGDETALLVDGVTKLDKVKFGDAAQAETVRKMVLAMAQDVRVLLIKLADRLHNARTWRYVPPESSARKAKETLEIYAPLAHRLGMNTIKWELEDLSFAALWPKVYAEIVRLVGERTPERQRNVAELNEMIGKELRDSKIKASISGRPKHYYSIYQKMIVKGKEFDDIYDLLGIRVLVDSVRDCYAALGVIHAKWSPLPGRFKDYVAMPKYNMYQSLHTTVIGPGGKRVEIQIRTYDMHQRAEYGVAAHWKYKSRGNDTDTPGWLRSVLDWQKDTKDPNEFLDSLRTEIGADEVYVFTPQGEVKALPAGATPVDFAYSVHTDVGHSTIGARVNGRLVPLNSVLHHGDWVEVFTSKNKSSGPSQDWLSFVRSPRARNKIRQWFSKERRDENIEKGKELLTKQARKSSYSIQQVMGAEILGQASEKLNLGDVQSLYAAIGEGNVSAQNAMEHIEALIAPEQKEEEPAVVDGYLDTSSIPKVKQPAASKQKGPGIIIPGTGEVMAKLARCCNPVPPDKIFGFITRGSGVSVHRSDCSNVAELKSDPERIVDVAWAPTQGSVFTVEIQVEALDRTSLLSDVTRVLAEHHVNILSAAVKIRKDRVAESRFVFEMGDPNYLTHVLNSVRGIDGVYDVFRASDRPR